MSKKFFVEISGNKLSKDDLKDKIKELNEAALERQKIFRRN